MLKKDLISSPGLWDLTLELHDESVTVTATPLVPGHEPLVREAPMNRVLSSQLGAFEELIYDNPLLLTDFHSVTLLIDTRRTFFVPTELFNGQIATRGVAALWPEGAYAAVSMELECVGETLVMALDEGLLAFIKRTYPDSRISHPMEVMIEWAAKDVDTDRLYVELRSGEMRMVGLRRAPDGERVQLALANTYPSDNADDAVYYILAAAQSIGSDVHKQPIRVAGTSPLDGQIVEGLSRLALVERI